MRNPQQDNKAIHTTTTNNNAVNDPAADVEAAQQARPKTHKGLPVLAVLVSAGLTAAAAAFIVAMVYFNKQKEACGDFECQGIDSIWQDIECNWLLTEVDHTCCCGDTADIDALKERLHAIGEAQSRINHIVPAAVAAGVAAVGTGITGMAWAFHKGARQTTQDFCSFFMRSRVTIGSEETQHLQTNQDPSYGTSLQD